MFTVKFSPSGMFHISLSLSSFNSCINTSKFSKGGFKLFFGIGEKFLGVDNSFVTCFTCSGVHVHVVFIFGDESVTDCNGLSMIRITNCFSIVAFL